MTGGRAKEPMTFGEKVIDDLEFYIKARIKESTEFGGLDLDKRRIKRANWAIDFLRAKGLLESRVTEGDKS